ncbi:MAG TPA: NADH-quinone oxidoreductase subunit L [Rhodothermales bacterium]|nr:NADH-quinone oxidoreductase subunit L [Rhodothermales bacterium]
MTQAVALIILLPLIGSALNGLLGLFVPGWRSQKAAISTVACLAVAGPFLLAGNLFLSFEQTEVVFLYQWVASGDLTIDVAYRIDQLSLLMTLIVTGVGALIHVYSIGYMGGDPGYWRYFSYLNLFIFAMLNLVLSDNLVGLFLGWEGVGLCSYLLIGFWYEDLSKSAAAMKAFIVNRIGDFAFLIGIFILFKELGGLDFDTVLAGTNTLSASTIGWVVLLFFIGATGKSAQIPLFVWLPDAMAGPTPVSALIHAATMVTSGLYLLARLSPLVLAAPEIMLLIAVVGALTAIMAATIAIAQNDIKKVLAYSTVSQLGYMFLAAGCGAFYVSIFHLMTHAFFKACLFLGSGSVIHAMHHVEHELHHRGSGSRVEHGMTAGVNHGDFDAQDIRTMGGLKKYMPSTYWTFLLATLAIAGIPGFAGFFSKDEILFKTFEAGYAGGQTIYYGLWIVGLLTALLTAIYMTRVLVLTFHGKERWPHSDTIRPHESPSSMTLPLWALGVLSVVGGYVGLPAVIGHGEYNWIHHWLGAPYGGPVAEPAMAGHGVPVSIEWMLIALGGLIAIAGVAYGWTRFGRYGLEFDNRIRGALNGAYTVFANKYYWDEFYDKWIVNPVMRLANYGVTAFDERVVDGAANGLATSIQSVAGRLRKIQTGVVQSYAVALVLGVVVVVGLFIWLG